MSMYVWHIYQHAFKGWQFRDLSNDWPSIWWLRSIGEIL